MRRSASQPPLIGPYLFTAPKAYAEQVGVYRQVAGFKGEIMLRYTQISPSSSFLRSQVMVWLGRVLFPEQLLGHAIFR